MKKVLEFEVLSLTLFVLLFCFIGAEVKKREKVKLDENISIETVKSKNDSKLGEKSAKELVHKYLGNGEFHFNAGPLYDGEYVEKLIFDVYYDNTDSRFNITLDGDLDYNNNQNETFQNLDKNDFSEYSYFEDSQNKIHRFYIENNDNKNINGVYKFKTKGSTEIKDIKLVLVKTNLNQSDYLYDDYDNSGFVSNSKHKHGDDMYEECFFGINSFEEYGEKFKEVTDSIVDQGANDAASIVGGAS